MAKQTRKFRTLKVGLAWAGSEGHPSDARRSVPLRALAPLLDCGAEVYSLQIGKASAQNWNGSGLIDVTQEFAGAFTAELPDFLDTAGLISQMDLVISVDTSVAHLAGAMGIPTWVLLSHAPDWRWGLGCEDTPWYPSVKLFRQIRLGDWSEMIARVARQLRSKIDNVTDSLMAAA